MENGIVTDSSGNVYVNDYYWCVRKITPEGVVTTFVGKCNYQSTADGTGATARFSSLRGLAIDASGTFFAGDYNRIIKITPEGVVTTINEGYLSGRGMAVSASGDLYYARKNAIYKTTQAGVETIFAGSSSSSGSAGYVDAVGTAARFSTPYSLAFDSSGMLYVAEAGNNCVRKITPEAAVTTLAGSCLANGYADGTGSEARFGSIYGIAVDSTGTIYVTDANNKRIRKITSSGTVTTLAGGGVSGSGDGVGAAAEFLSPMAITVDRSGVLYVTDQNRIRVIK